MTALDLHVFRGDRLGQWWLAGSELRHQVFVKEQHVAPVLELDARDYLPTTWHLVGTDAAGNASAVCRVLVDGEGDFHIGRVAVLKRARGRGLGSWLIRQSVDLAQELLPAGARGRVLLDAQVQAIAFYEREEFSLTDDEPFLDADIWHRTMSRPIVNTSPPGEGGLSRPLG